MLFYGKVEETYFIQHNLTCIQKATLFTLMLTDITVAQICNENEMHINVL